MQARMYLHNHYFFKPPQSTLWWMTFASANAILLPKQPAKVALFEGVLNGYDDRRTY
jgi:hypothetical protein